MSNIDKQALREEFRFMQVHYSDPADRARQVIYIAAEALLDELETKEEQRANWFQMAQKLGEDLDAAEKRNAEQREYYEGVIADGSKRIAELESKNSNLRTIAHEQNELAIRANLDSINDAVEMDSLHKRIAELERSETQLISERDDAESALNDAYKAVMGQAPEWSNWFSFENAIDEIELACELWRNQTDDVIQFRQLIAEQSAIVAAAEKLVRCKGRYHSELNYRALAKLFGVVTPDLPPLEHENVHYADAAEVEITALRQRIQELEAKLETADKLQDGAFRDGLKAGFSYGQTDDQSGFTQCMSAYSTRAGIGVKQQEDSVDSDVGRNQPGMVVAVHIDAGDFVKFKGQVFEVEETDFDDHDVTLWFVGGNTLKCAAGCQVEVVSAPVAAGIKVKG